MIFKTRLLERDFYTLITNVPFSSLTDVGSHNSPFWGLAPSLAHRPISGSDIIYYSLSSLLADIACFDPLCIVVSLTVLKRVY